MSLFTDDIITVDIIKKNVTLTFLPYDHDTILTFTPSVSLPKEQFLHQPGVQILPQPPFHGSGHNHYSGQLLLGPYPGNSAYSQPSNSYGGYEGSYIGISSTITHRNILI